ncbi:unnamed protein product [Symbiodinium natans]|uniref:Uncharacterized protein n=1 Tax=Symbiodinium natans TaxID=878477 RepID=A0A812PCS2_9DINO|nr:unnamed protein product [Symbiodinium natans]
MLISGTVAEQTGQWGGVARRECRAAAVAESSSGRAAVLGQQWQGSSAEWAWQGSSGQLWQGSRAGVAEQQQAESRQWQGSRAEWQSSSGSHKVATGSPLGTMIPRLARFDLW